MEIKDKRMVEQLDIDEQSKYLKEIAEHLPDVQDKCERCEVTYSPINILKRLKLKPADEKQKEKTSDLIQDGSAAKGQQKQ